MRALVCGQTPSSVVFDTDRNPIKTICRTQLMCWRTSLPLGRSVIQPRLQPWITRVSQSKTFIHSERLTEIKRFKCFIFLVCLRRITCFLQKVKRKSNQVFFHPGDPPMWWCHVLPSGMHHLYEGPMKRMSVSSSRDKRKQDTPNQTACHHLKVLSSSDGPSTAPTLLLRALYRNPQ